MGKNVVTVLVAVAASLGAIAVAMRVPPVRKLLGL